MKFKWNFNRNNNKTIKSDMDKTQTIPIFFATDDNYIPYLAVTIKSIIENCHPLFNYKIHVLNTGLSMLEMIKIKSLETKFLKIEFNNVASKIASIKATLDENLRDYYSDAIYYRIFIPSMFPEYKRAIYLDCDLVVLGDISRLFFTDMQNNWLASVQDEVAPSNPVLIDYVEKAVGIPIKNYFCSGVLLMDLEALRTNQVENKFVGLLNKYNFDTIAPDQDYLNAICKDHVLMLHPGWDRQANKRKYHDSIYIIHYNMFRKPWLYKKVPYEGYFWQYAAMTPYYYEILHKKDTFTKEQRTKNIKGVRAMISTCANIINQRITFRKILENCSVEEALKKDTIKDFDSMTIDERMQALEKMGGEYFYIDVNNDPPTKPLKNVDYLKQNPIHKLQAAVANTIAHSYRKKLKKQLNMQFVGKENLQNVDTGAIITSNHFSTADSVPIYWITKAMKPKRKMWTLVREGNWNIKGLSGFFLKHCNTLPLSENYKNMTKLNKSVEKLLKKKNVILIYPEQAMWPNYKKPRPQKIGAFHYACKNNVPVIPCFTTINDAGEYTTYIMKPIYPDKQLSTKLAATKMRDENYKLCCDKYQEIYGKKLKYSCDK